MKFFKHFADAHRGQSLQKIMEKCGPAGIGRYWILIEICAEKLTKEKDEEYTDAHCYFSLHRSYLRDTLRTHQLNGVEMFLRCLTDVGLMSYTCEDDVYTIHMPKLLESLDRDTKRTRKERGPTAPKRKNKEKDKEKEYIYIREFENAWFEYAKLPGVTKGVKARERFQEQILNLDEYKLLLIAISNYQKVLALPVNLWRKPKTTLETFLGTKSSGYFWRDWIDIPSVEDDEESLRKIFEGKKS